MEIDPLIVGESRIHELLGYFNTKNLFIKRDDELGFGIGGSKVRKYEGIIQEAQKHDLIIIEGSHYSNNSIGLIPLLRQKNIKFKVVLHKVEKPKHNALWLSSILKSEEIIGLPKGYKYPTAEWYKKTLGEVDYFVVPEGAYCPAAFASLLSLPQEILKYESEKGIVFDDIFIDSGSGLTALALIVGLLFNKPFQKIPKIHVCLAAGSRDEFLKNGEKLLKKFDESLQLNKVLKHLNFHQPFTSKAFGSVNSSIKKEWKVMMKEIGIPIDLTYTAKHFGTLKKMFSENSDFFNERRKLIVNTSSWFAARNHEHQLSLNLEMNE